jgi:hypothetical protein
MGDVKFDRPTLVKSMTLLQFDTQFQKRDIRRELEERRKHTR